MSYLVLVNSKSGTVRDRGGARLRDDLEQAFSRNGADADIRLIHPRDFEKNVRDTLQQNDRPSSLIIGGGDGTLSTAAGPLAGSDVALGILPLGTMNLMARALEIPLDPAEAVEVLTKSRPERIDLLNVAGHKVLMHASIGLQPKVIRIRESLPYRTRFMRLVNGTIAWFKATRRLETYKLRGEADKEIFERRTSAVLISNNALREEMGGAPVAHDLTRGEVAIYLTTSSKRSDLVRLALASSLGVWRDSNLVEEFRTREIEIDTDKGSLLVALDGELEMVETPFTVKIIPRCLTMLMPSARSS